MRLYVWLPHGGVQSNTASGAAIPIAILADMDTATPHLWFVHSDHLARPILMTSTSQETVWSATYLPFGAVHEITGSAANDNRFPGQYFQLESGLHYNWHRHYDPSLARYIQPDPLGLIDGPSRYAYVRSNPLQLVDPRGEAAHVIVAGGAALVAAAIIAASPQVRDPLYNRGKSIEGLIFNNEKSNSDSIENCPTQATNFSSFPPPNSGDPNEQKCRILVERIKNLQKELFDKRYPALASNPTRPNPLPERIGPGEQLRDTVRGHRKLINRQDRILRKYEKEYNKICRQ